jgi:transposase-like protein
MNRDTRKADAGQSISETKPVLEEVLRQGAREMLLRAIEAEVAGYIDQHSELRDEAGHRLVVRNGHLPEREILTGIGPVAIRQPRVNDKRPGQKFTSSILPPFMRRVPSIDALISCLYLKGISTGDITAAFTPSRMMESTGASPTIRSPTAASCCGMTAPSPIRDSSNVRSCSFRTDNRLISSPPPATASAGLKT